MKETTYTMLTWAFLFIFVPTLIGMAFMNATLVPVRIPLPEKGYALSLSSKSSTLDLQNTPLQNFTKEFFGTPLTLKRYRLCLINHNDVYLNGKKIPLPYEKDNEAGAMEATINFQNGSSTNIYTPVNITECENVNFEGGIVNISMIYRTPISDEFIKTENGFSQETYVRTDNSTFLIRIDFEELIYKILIVIFVYINVVVNIVTSWRFINRRVGKRAGCNISTDAPRAPQNREQSEEKERRKQKILSLLAERGEVRNDEVQKVLGVSDASATNYLDELEKEGKVAQSASTGRGVSYRKIAI